MRKLPVCRRLEKGRPASTGRAFEAVWEEHAEELLRRCRHWMGSHDLGEEAFSRAAIVAFEKYGYHSGAILDTRAWLVAVVRNVCMDFHRERKRDRFDMFEGIDLQRVAAYGNPEKDLIRGELALLLRRAVEELPPRLRVPLELVLYEERSYRDVARLLDVTEPNLRKRMQQARTRVRARLRAYDRGRPPRPARVSEAATERPAPLTRYLIVQTIVRPDGTSVDVERFADELPRHAGEAELRRLRGHVARHATGWKMRVRLARALLERGQTAEAVVHYRAALNRRPDRGAVALELAAILRACGELAESGQLRDAVRANATAADAALLDAYDTLSAGRMSDAIAQLEPIASAGHSVALTLLGDALREIGMTSRARVCLELAREPARVRTDRANVHEAAALALVEHGDKARAIERMRAFAARETMNAGAWLAFARVAAAAGDPREAAPAAIRACMLDPSAIVVAAKIVAGFDPERAAMLIASAPRSWPAAVAACEIHARRATETQYAESLAAAVLALEPSLAMSWIRAGEVLLAGGLLESALASFARALTLLPNDDGDALAAAAANGIATCYELLDDLEAAAVWRRSGARVTGPAGSTTM